MVQLQFLGATPKREDLNKTTKEISLDIGIPHADLDFAIKVVECEIPFQMEKGILIKS